MLYYLFTPYSVTSIQASPGGPVNILYLTHVLNYWPIIYHNSCQWKLNNALQDFTTSSCRSWPRRGLWPFKVGRRSTAPVKNRLMKSFFYCETAVKTKNVADRVQIKPKKQLNVKETLRYVTIFEKYTWRIHENENLTKKELVVIAISAFESLEAWMMSLHLTRKSLTILFLHSSLESVQITAFVEDQARDKRPK